MMKQYLAEYYQSASNFYGSYHSQKEISAWAGLSIHVLFCGLILNANVPDDNKYIALVGFAIITLIVAFFAFLHIRNQLALKDRGSALRGASQLILAEILSKPESELNSQAYLKIVPSTDTKFQSSHHLPKRLLEEADIINERGRSYAARNKSITYWLWGVSTVSTIAIKWAIVLG